MFHRSVYIKLVFLLWLGLMMTALLLIPYHYDEAYSYYWFTSHGWGRIMTFFPLPNNHIFYNMVAYPFTWLPIDPAITTRLPSLLAAILSLVYTIKLCRHYFSEQLSLFLGFLLASTYPFILYGIEGRGYGFLIACCVLQLYAGHHLSTNYRSLRYRLLYSFALGAGMYTMYSYLYTALPIHLLLFAYILRQSRRRSAASPQTQPPPVLRLFARDTSIVTAILLLLYWIIVNHNGLDVILHPNGSQALSYSQLLPAMVQHFRDTWAWLTNTPLPVYTVLLLIAASLAERVVRKREHPWLNIAVVILLMTPPMLLVIKPVIFFVRTWTPLIVPIVLGIGFLFSGIAALTARRRPVPLRITTPLLAATITILLLAQFYSFMISHRQAFTIDYAIRGATTTWRPQLEAAQTVWSTHRSMEYYLAEQLLYERGRRHPDRPLSFSTKSMPSGQDLLIIDPNMGLKAYPQLVNYQMIFYSPSFGLVLYVNKRLLSLQPITSFQ